MLPEVRYPGIVPYAESLQAMQDFTAARTAATQDEIWFLEHPPVYTLGMGGRMQHVLAPGGTPVIRSDRGGQVTWHGPGQLIAYVLLDLRRLGLGVRALVTALEGAVLGLLEEFGVQGARRPGAPGVYVDDAKIAALGIRVRRNCSYHGLALNVTADLGPFDGIDPCGYPGLEVTSLAQLGINVDCETAARRLLPHLLKELGYEAAGRRPQAVATEEARA